MQPNFLCNSSLGPALRVELNHLLIACVPMGASSAPLLLRHRFLRGRRGLSFTMLSTQGGNHPTEYGLLPRQDSFQTVHRVEMQVETISDVKRMGSPTPNRIGKGEATVACHDLHTGMLAKPSGNRFHLTVG